MNGPGRELTAEMLNLISRAEFALCMFVNLASNEPRRAWEALVELSATLQLLQKLFPPHTFKQDSNDLFIVEPEEYKIIRSPNK